MSYRNKIDIDTFVFSVRGGTIDVQRPVRASSYPWNDCKFSIFSHRTFLLYLLLSLPRQTHLTNERTELSNVICSDAFWFALSSLCIFLCVKRNQTAGKRCKFTNSSTRLDQRTKGVKTADQLKHFENECDLKGTIVFFSVNRFTHWVVKNILTYSNIVVENLLQKQILWLNPQNAFLHISGCQCGSFSSGWQSWDHIWGGRGITPEQSLAVWGSIII